MIRREGVGLPQTEQWMALQGLLGMLMSSGRWGSILNSSQFLPPFFFPVALQASYSGSCCHGSRFYSAIRTGVLWCIDSCTTGLSENYWFLNTMYWWFNSKQCLLCGRRCRPACLCASLRVPMHALRWIRVACVLSWWHEAQFHSV